MIFLTDDKKGDWWAITKDEKSIGPRAELIDEISMISNVQNFSMYSTEQLVDRASWLFNISISEQEIEDVKRIAKPRSEYQRGSSQTTLYGRELVTEIPVWTEQDFAGTGWTCRQYVPNNANQQEGFTWLFNTDGSGEWHARGQSTPPETKWTWTNGELMVTNSDGNTHEFPVTAHRGKICRPSDDLIYLINTEGELSSVGYMHCERWNI